MSQFGMQMPAARRKASTLNVYTALAALAMVSLAAACYVVFKESAKISPDGSPFSLQEAGKIKLPK
jgi:hypothetical protein